MNKPEYIIIHHAEAKGDVDIDDVRQWHLDRGWSDIGYHYYIRRDGRIQNGRDESVVGAHCTHMGMNRKSIGICFEGHHDFEYWTDHQWLSFWDLALSLMEKYSIPAKNIMGHRETGSPKKCPGSLIDCDVVRDRIRKPIVV